MLFYEVKEAGYCAYNPNERPMMPLGRQVPVDLEAEDATLATRLHSGGLSHEVFVGL